MKKILIIIFALFVLFSLLSPKPLFWPALGWAGVGTLAILGTLLLVFIDLLIIFLVIMAFVEGAKALEILGLFVILFMLALTCNICPHVYAYFF